MSVRKRSWKSKGETKTAWVVDYCDQRGAPPHQDLCPPTETPMRSTARLRSMSPPASHTPDRESITVAAAGRCGCAIAAPPGRNARP